MPLKVGAWSTMAVGVLYFAININMGIVAAAFSSSPGEVMVAVSGSILTGLLGFAVALYLTALIRSLLAKAIVNATPLEFLLMGVAIASGVLCIFLLETGSAVLPTALLVLPLNAALSYLAAARLTR
ncbi:hypothetical protein AXK59_23695 [Tsukamurella tyrosinosolvens]|nr:hypothetical protein AXK59_23695 [Tsukamurella tyrosinosolvens]